MRDFLPSDIRKREYVIGIIKEVYESYGFEPLETSAVENLETLTGKSGEESNQLMFKILKRGEKLEQQLNAGEIKSENELSDLALRYDLTVPLARVVANYKNELPKFFKRYQIQPVWRADRPAKGRYREFYQCDVDAIGSSSMLVEAELISAVTKILRRLGFEDFVIRVNHRKILTGLLEQFGLSPEKYTDALIAIDKLDKIGASGVFKELIDRGISEKSSEEIVSFFKSMADYNVEIEKTIGKIPHDDEDNYGEIGNLKDFKSGLKIGLNQKTIEVISKSFKEKDIDSKGLNEINTILELIKQTDVAIYLWFDPSLARGLSYYTGAILEINVPDLAGSLGGGGRYDGLIGMFGKEQIPACGFSIGLERILVVMEERGMFPENLQQNSADIMVTIWNEETIGESLKLANQLRSQGLRVLVYPEADKLGKQFKYADSINIPFVCVLGETELAENKVTLKNMQTGEQETIARNEIASKVKNR